MTAAEVVDLLTRFDRETCTVDGRPATPEECALVGSATLEDLQAAQRMLIMESNSAFEMAETLSAALARVETTP